MHRIFSVLGAGHVTKIPYRIVRDISIHVREAKNEDQDGIPVSNEHTYSMQSMKKTCDDSDTNVTRTISVRKSVSFQKSTEN